MHFLLKIHISFNYTIIGLTLVTFGMLSWFSNDFIYPGIHIFSESLPLIICGCQIYTGYVRPRQFNTRREYFKVFYFFGGNISMLLGAGALFIAIPEYTNSYICYSLSWFYTILPSMDC
jgi:hypothetical protein